MGISSPSSPGAAYCQAVDAEARFDRHIFFEDSGEWESDRSPTPDASQRCRRRRRRWPVRRCSDFADDFPVRDADSCVKDHCHDSDPAPAHLRPLLDGQSLEIDCRDGSVAHWTVEVVLGPLGSGEVDRGEGYSHGIDRPLFRQARHSLSDAYIWPFSITFVLRGGKEDKLDQHWDQPANLA